MDTKKIKTSANPMAEYLLQAHDAWVLQRIKELSVSSPPPKKKIENNNTKSVPDDPDSDDDDIGMMGLFD